MSDDEAHPRPGSYASLERRVEAVEQSLAGVRTDVAVIQRDMAHQSELAVSHYRTVEAQNGEIKATVSGMQALIERALRDPYSVMPEQARTRDEWAAWRGTVDGKLDSIERRDVEQDTITADRRLRSVRLDWVIGLVAGVVTGIAAAILNLLTHVVNHG